MHDNNGNLVSFTPGTYTWNARNLLTAASDGTSSFSYDAIGRQVSRKVQSVTTTDMYDGANPVVINGSLMLNGVGLDDNFARITGSVATSCLTDALGSTKALTDATGAVSASYTYQPYGGTTKTGTDDTPLQFTGRENDGAPGLYYYRARYYGAKIGRFISEDPIGLSGGLNFYAYANGDPIDNTDPSGEFVPLIVILPVIGGIAGGIADVISAGPCTKWYSAFGRGFVSGATGTLTGIGVIAATGNPWLAGAASGAVSQGLDQAISGETNVGAGVVGVAAGAIGGGAMAKILPTVGRLPSLVLPRTLQNIGPNSLRMMGQETGSDAVGAAAGVAVPGNGGAGCGCQ